MHILVISSSYHPHKGGVETVVSDLARGILPYGDRVIVVTNLWPSTLPMVDFVDGVIVVRVPMVLPWASIGITARIKGVISNIILSFIMLLFRPSIINIQCVGPNGYWGKLLGDRFKVPIVVSTHGERTNDSSGFYSVHQNEGTYQRVINSAKAVVCVSEVSARESITDYGVIADNLIVIPNAITVVDQPALQVDRTVDIIFVGRLVPEKGVDTLIKAVSNLWQRFPDLTVSIVGDGPSFHELNRLVVDAGLIEHVLFLGQLNSADVHQRMMMSNILVLPSRKESFGIVLLEAANAGCAIVASSTGGIPSIVEHEANGLLFEVDSVEQLERHLDCLLSDEARRLELVTQFSARLQQYDITNFINEYRSVFAGVASQ